MDTMNHSPGESSLGLKLITHLQLLPWLIMRGATPPRLCNTSWRGA